MYNLLNGARTAIFPNMNKETPACEHFRPRRPAIGAVSVKAALLALLLAGARAGANVYYVDISSGSDSSAGTSASAAWEHCPGDASASGLPQSTALAPGDTVIFKGGVAYTNSIVVNWSGAPGTPIVYDGNSAGTWGVSNAIIDEQYLNPFCIKAVARANVVIKNFICEHAGGIPMNQYANYSPPTSYMPSSTGYGFYLTDDTNLIIQQCFIKEIGYWTNAMPISFSHNGQESFGNLHVFVPGHPCDQLLLHRLLDGRPMQCRIPGTDHGLLQCGFFGLRLAALHCLGLRTGAGGE